jgi:hypothetical protein
VGRFRIGLDATHAGIRSSLPSTMGSPMTSPVQGTLPYHSALTGEVHSFGGRLEPRSIIGAPSLDQ